VTSCPRVCPREVVSQDKVSPGVIRDEETVARGAFLPSHGNPRTKNIRPGLIPRSHLFDGEGSVWRVGESGIGLESLVPLLKASRPDSLFGILAANAADIRRIRLGAEGPRAFSLVDECDCDQHGSKHPAHGHIALCRVQKEAGVTVDAPAFIDAHRALIETMKRTWIWEAQSPSNPPASNPPTRG
jgi:hypothetical protein